MQCPKCDTKLRSENINIETDLAKCHSCDNIFKLSHHFYEDQDDGFDMNRPPKNCWVIKDREQLIIGASTRSPIAFFMVPFMIVWSGGSIGGIYGIQILNGEFDLMMSLFGIPFLIGSVIFWALALMAIWGKIELTLGRTGGQVLTGIGNIGWKKHFSWDEISSIKEVAAYGNHGRKGGATLQLEGEKRITFGHGLNDSRRYYLFKTMKQVLRKVKYRSGVFSPF